jgi:hypothetical protein
MLGVPPASTLEVQLPLVLRARRVRSDSAGKHTQRSCQPMPPRHPSPRAAAAQAGG